MSAQAFHTDYDRPPWIKVPLAKLKEYKPGRRTMAPSWWAVTDDGCVLFYRNYGSPQCNVVREIVEKVRPGLRVVKVDQAYVPDRHYPIDRVEWLPLSKRG